VRSIAASRSANANFSRSRFMDIPIEPSVTPVRPGKLFAARLDRRRSGEIDAAVKLYGGGAARGV